MGVGAADQDAVFLNDPEARGRLPRSGEGAGPAGFAEGGGERGGFGGDAGAAGEDVEGDAFAEQDLAHGPAHGRDVRDWRDGLAFLDVPFDSAGGVRFDGFREGGGGGRTSSRVGRRPR